MLRCYLQFIITTDVKFYPLIDILGVFCRQPCQGVIKLESKEGRVCYLVMTGRGVGFVSDYLPEDAKITEELVAITNQESLKGLSPRQFLARGVGENRFSREEFDKKLSRYIIDRLYDLFNQDFYVQLCHAVRVDVDFGIAVSYLLHRLQEKQQTWYQHLSTKLLAKGQRENATAQQNLTLADLVCLPLTAAKENDRVYLHRLEGQEQNAKLLGMGLAPGVEIQIVNVLPEGGVVVGWQEQRLGIGADMADKILVISASDWQKIKATTAAPAVKLAQAPLGSRLRIVGYEPTGRAYKQKLLAMGLTPGVDIVVKRHAPLGDPTEIEVRGFALSLRKEEADALKVVLLEGGER